MIAHYRLHKPATHKNNDCRVPCTNTHQSCYPEHYCHGIEQQSPPHLAQNINHCSFKAEELWHGTVKRVADAICTLSDLLTKPSMMNKQSKGITPFLRPLYKVGLLLFTILIGGLENDLLIK